MGKSAARALEGMGLVIDPSLPVAEDRRRFDWNAFDDRIGEQKLYISAMTMAELATGIALADSEKHRQRRLQALAEFEARVEIIPFGRREALVYGGIFAELRRRGRHIGNHDLVIAATAMAHGHAVATLNARHFREVEGLSVMDAEEFRIEPRR